MKKICPVTIYEPINEVIDKDWYTPILNLASRECVEKINAFSNIDKLNQNFGMEVITNKTFLPRILRDSIGMSYYVSMYLFGMGGTRDRLSTYKDTLYRTVQHIYENGTKTPRLNSSTFRSKRWKNISEKAERQLANMYGRPHNNIILALGNVLENHSYFSKMKRKDSYYYLAFITCVDIPAFGELMDYYLDVGGEEIDFDSGLGLQLYDDLSLISSIIVDNNQYLHRTLSRETNLSYAYTMNFSSTRVDYTTGKNILHKVRCSSLLGKGYYGFIYGGPVHNSYILGSNRKTVYPNDAGKLGKGEFKPVESLDYTIFKDGSSIMSGRNTESVIATTECVPIHELQKLIFVGEF